MRVREGLSRSQGSNGSRGVPTALSEVRHGVYGRYKLKEQREPVELSQIARFASEINSHRESTGDVWYEESWMSPRSSESADLRCIEDTEDDGKRDRAE